MNNKDKSFEQLIIDKVKHKILSEVANSVIIERYIEIKIPEDIIQRAWESINWEEVLDYVTEKLQEQVCQTIVNNMLTEVKTDTKKILSIEGVRKRIRERVYPYLKKVLDEIEKDNK